jgi:hypothetical protein
MTRTRGFPLRFTTKWKVEKENGFAAGGSFQPCHTTATFTADRHSSSEFSVGPDNN